MTRLAILVTVLSACAAGAWVQTGPSRASVDLFQALNQNPGLRATAVADLTRTYSRDPGQGRTALHLGLAHLWTASDSPPEQALPNLVLAEHYLSRAKSLRPDDDRIAGWLIPASIARARLERDDAAVEEGVKAMRLAAAAATPDQQVFHAVPLAIVTFDKPPNSPEFTEALALMRKVAQAGPEQRAAGNAERWPHNVEGFMLGLADMELKAGNRQRAAVMLQAITERPGFDNWRYKQEVDTRLEHLQERAKPYTDSDPANDPPLAFGYGGIGCLLCHGGDNPPPRR